jgi:hypothetical protein
MTNRDHIINFCGAARALVTQTKVMTDQELADIYAMTAVFTRLLDDTRKELVARCKAHGNAGGYILRPVSGNREIRDIRAAYVALRTVIPKDEFLKACSVSITKLESTFINIQMHAGVFRDYTVAKRAFNASLGPILELQPEHLKLCKLQTPPHAAPVDEDIL